MSNYLRNSKLLISLPGLVIAAAAIPVYINYLEGHPFFFISFELLKDISVLEFNSQLKGIFNLELYLDEVRGFGVNFCKAYGLDLEIEDLREFIGNHIATGNGLDTVDNAMQNIVVTAGPDDLIPIQAWRPNVISTSLADDIWKEVAIRARETFPDAMVREMNKSIILDTCNYFLIDYKSFLDLHILNPAVHLHPSTMPIYSPLSLDEKITWLSSNCGTSKILQRQIYHDSLNLKFLSSLIESLPLHEQGMISDDFNNNHVRVEESLARCQQLVERNLIKFDVLSIGYSTIQDAPVDI